MNKRGGGPLDWHAFWKQLHKLKANDWGVSLHELVMRMVDRAGSYDGVDIFNLACLEDALRQAQLVEYTYWQLEGEDKFSKGKGKGRAGLIEEASIFAGIHRDAGDVMVAPELLDFVSKEVERDASIMKQIRKAREERVAAAKT